nr:MAG TPA: hypothetical protein [Caudoviricetes sp.]
MLVPPLLGDGIGEDQVRGQDLRPEVVEHGHAVVVGQGNLLRVLVGVNDRRLCDRAVDHNDRLRGRGKEDAGIDADAVEGGEVFGGGVHVRIVDGLVQVVAHIAIEGGGQDQAHDVAGNAPDIVVLDGFKGLDQGFDDLPRVGHAGGGGEGRPFVEGRLEEGRVELCRHGVDVVVSAPGHDVSDAEGVQVELRGFLDDLLVGVQVHGGRGNGQRGSLAGGPGGPVVLGHAVLEAAILDGPAGGVAGVGLGFQTGRQGVLLNVMDHQTGQFGQFDLRRPVLDQADRFGSCHNKIIPFVCWWVGWLDHDRTVDLCGRLLTCARVSGLRALDVGFLRRLLGLEQIGLRFLQGFQKTFQVCFQAAGVVDVDLVQVQKGNDVGRIVGLVGQGQAKGRVLLDSGDFLLVVGPKGVDRGLGGLDVFRDLRGIAGPSDRLQGFGGGFQGVFRAGLAAVRTVELLGRDEGTVVSDDQVHVLSVLALAFQGRFDLVCQVCPQNGSDALCDHGGFSFLFPLFISRLPRALRSRLFAGRGRLNGYEKSAPQDGERHFQRKRV